MGLVVGIDLGRKSDHDAVIFRRAVGKQIGRGFRFASTPRGIQKLFDRVEKVQEPGEEVEFVTEIMLYRPIWQYL